MGLILPQRSWLSLVAKFFKGYQNSRQIYEGVELTGLRQKCPALMKYSGPPRNPFWVVVNFLYVLLVEPRKRNYLKRGVAKIRIKWPFFRVVEDFALSALALSLPLFTDG